VGERERGHRLIVGYAATGAAVIIVVHLSGGANGTQGGYVEHPVLRLLGLVVWGALVGATTGWLVRATPSRAVLPLGLGTIFAAIGFLVGLWFAVNVQGQSVIDGNERVQLLSSPEGAGASWVIGASVGLALATKQPKPSRADAWRTRGVAVAVLLLGVLAAWWEVLGEASGRRSGYAVGAGIQRAWLVDAALVALTLLVVAGIRQRRDTEPAIRDGTGALMNGIGRVGRGLGCFVLICGLAGAPQARRSSETPRQVRTNYRTLSIVGSAASRYMEERGSVPPTFDRSVASAHTHFAERSSPPSSRTRMACVSLSAPIMTGSRSSHSFRGSSTSPTGTARSATKAASGSCRPVAMLPVSAPFRKDAPEASVRSVPRGAR
jgi:hypothetical protein